MPLDKTSRLVSKDSTVRFTGDYFFGPYAIAKQIPMFVKNIVFHLNTYIDPLQSIRIA